VSLGIGVVLREAREGQGRSLEDAAAPLRARASQLEALEQERFGDFGGDVYARGFLRSYATELGLDPTPLLETYRREVGHDLGVMDLTTSVSVGRPGRQRAAPPAWMAWVLVAVVVLAGVALVGSLDMDAGRTPEQASPAEPPPAPASGPADEQQRDPSEEPADRDTDADPGEAPEAAEPTPEPDPEPEPEGVDLLIALEADSWMRVLVDGAPVLEQVVEAGQTLPFEGDQEIEIRFGNAGGVRANLNGEDLGVVGSSGEAITIRYTEEGFEEA
jgi:cytoskeleton protein RodZ